MYSWTRVIKSVFDKILAVFGLFAFLPLFILICFGIWLEDGFPIFFSQERVGLKGRIFKAIKFRTMKKTNVPYADIDLLEDDSRVTRLGRVLRATAMDELPQLFNILKNDMSFVGPRALPFKVSSDDSLRYSTLEDVPGYSTRIKVLPGLTGISQLYASKTIPVRNKFMFDNLYVRKQSLFLDFKLIVKSFLVTIKAKWETNSKKI